MKYTLLSLTLLLIIFSSFPVVYSSGEIDKIVYVEWVQDGDTFRTNDDEWIRLADVDTPESGDAGYWEATNYMIETVKNKTVYLDIDDIYTYDEKNGEKGQGDRLVCVVYVDYNQTHYLNVNKSLLENTLAVKDDYDNEFNPDSWSLYVSKEEIPEFSSIIFILSLLLVSMIVVIFIKEKAELG